MKFNCSSVSFVALIVFLALVGVFVMGSVAVGQTAGDYRSAATGNWNSTSTWERFDGSSWVAAVATPTSSDGVITIRNGHTVTISASGLSFDQVVVDSGGQVTVASGITSTLANGTGTDLTINGTWLNSGGTWTISASATWSVGSGGTFIHNTTSGISTPLGAATLNANSNFIYRGSSTLKPAVSLSGRTYGNLSFESTSGSLVFNNGTGGTALTINGNFSVGASGAGTVTDSLGLTGTPGHAFKGNVTIGSGSTLVFSPLSSSTFNFSGSSAQTLTNSGTLTIGANQSFVVSNSSGLTLASSVTMGGGTMTVNAGASLATAGTYATGSGSTTINGTFQLNQSGFASGSNFVYGASGKLIFNNSSGSYGVNSGHVYWPTSSGPSTVVVQNGGGMTLNDPRTVTTLFQVGNGTATGVTSNGNLTVNGTCEITSGGYFTGGPIYGSSSTLKINNGSTYGRGDEWSATSGAGYPNNVQISGSSTYDLSNGATGTARQMGGTLTIDLGSTFTLNNMTANLTVVGNVSNTGTLTLSTAIGGDIVVGGNWTRASTFNSNSRQVEFNGTSDQTITVSAGETFDYLRVNKSSGSLILANGVTVNNTLTFTSGNISTGSNTLSLASGGSVSRTSGHVIGNFKKTYASASSKDFEVGTANGYSPVTVNAASGGDFTVKAVQGSHSPAFAGNTIGRYWTLTNGGLSSADLTFNYLDPTDLSGVTEGNLAIRKYNGSVWSSPGGSVNTSGNTATINGVSSFSDWTLAECPTITISGSLPAGTVGTSYSTTLSASGGNSPYSFSLSSGSSLPAGLSLNSSTGAITGTPTTAGTAHDTIIVTDTAGCTGTRIDSIVVSCPTITVSPSSLPNGQNGVSYGIHIISASGGNSPYTYSVSAGSLPTGITLSNDTVSGTPTANGTYTFTLTATDAYGCTGSRNDTVVVTSCPVFSFSPSSLANRDSGSAFSDTVHAIGGTAPYTYTLNSGSVPPGMSLTDSILSGTPTTPGTYTFEVKATDFTGCTGLKTYTITICGIITPGSLTGGTVGTAYLQKISVSGGTAGYAFAKTSGTLPTGLSLSHDTLSGTPTKAGTYNFDITVTDTNGCTGVRSYTLTFSCPTITVSGNAPDGFKGISYSHTVTASGGTPPDTFVVISGSLPNGLSLSLGGGITGTPTTNGTFIFTIQATDADSCQGSQIDTVVITCPTITLATLPNGTVGTAYLGVSVASGGVAPYTYAKTSGTLPTGLTLSNDTLSGTPTTAGVYNFDITATDANGCTGVRSYSDTVTCPAITLSPSSLKTGTENVAYADTVTASGGTSPYTFAVTLGSLPSGISLSSAGILSGSTSSPGSYPIDITATDAYGCTGVKSYTLTIGSASDTTISNGNWSDGTIWSTGAKPTASQNAYIKHTVTLTANDTCMTATVKSGGILHIKKFNLGLVGTYTIEAGGEGRQSIFEAIPGRGATPQSFATTSTYMFDSSATGFSNSNVTFGNLHWGSTANATPSVGTVINGNLTKDSVGQFRCGTGATTSRTITVHGNVIVNGGSIVGSNSSGAITGALDVDGNITVNSGGTITGVNSTGQGTISVGGNFTSSGIIQTGAGSGNWLVYFKGSNTSNFDAGTTNTFRNIAVAPGRTINLLSNDSLSTSTYTFTDSGTVNMGTKLIKGGGNFTLISGGTLGIGSVDGITSSGATGNVQVTGTRTFSTGGNYTYNGSSAQVTGNGLPATANNLTFSNSAGVTLSASSTASGTAALGSTIVATGSNTLGVGASGTLTRTSGYVNGNLQKNVATGSAVSRSYEIGDASNYTPLSLTFGNVSVAGNLKAKSVAGEQPNIGTSHLDTSKDVNRYFTLTNSGVTFDSANATFNFVSGDVDGAANTSNFVVKKFDSPSTWSSLGTGSRTSTSTDATGIKSFSDFAIGEVLTHTISVSAGANGSISPPGPTVTVNDGDTLTFTITPNGGYSVSDVLVDAVSQGGISSYTFNNITANHTISATFTNVVDTIFASKVGSGTISPTGTVLVAQGNNQIFTITPATGNHIDSVVADGVNLGAVAVDTFKNVVTNHTITAYFSINVYTITASVSGGNGTISPSGAVSANYGTDKIFTMTPNTGYHIDSVKIDGAYVGNTSPDTIKNIQANHTIVVKFKINSYTITASVTGGSGTIAPPGVPNVTY